MKFINLVLVSSLILSVPCRATDLDLSILEGIHVGNGGDVVTCYGENGSITDIELLDYYEANLLHGRTVDLGAPDLEIKDKIRIALARLEQLDPKRVQEYRILAEEFWSEVQFLEGIVLTDIPDSQHVALPANKNCRIEQVAIQRQPTFPEDFRYIVSKDLWDRLDNTGKAGLILHEIFLNEAIGEDVQHSIGVRYLNALISDAGAISRLSLKRYVELLVRAEFTKIGIDGLMLELDPSSPLVFDDLDRLVHGRVVKNSVSETPFGSISLDCYVELLGGRIQSFYTSTRFEFEQNGKIWSHAAPLPQSPDYCKNSAQYVRLFDTGVVERAYLWPGATIVTPAYNLYVHKFTTFWPNGQLQRSQTWPSQGVSTINSGAGDCAIVGDSSIDFHENGTLENVRLLDLCIVRIGTSVIGVDNGLWFHSNGNVSIASVREGQIDTGANGHVAFAKEGDNIVSFYPSGAVKNGNLKEGRVMNTAGGGTQWYPADTRLKFDEAGFVTGFF